jgi:GxxExxY protein
MKSPIMLLCDVVREVSFEIHRYLRHGHLEKIYENALAHRLRKRGIVIQQQWPLTVYDQDDFVLGEFAADLYLQPGLIVELKACRSLADEHTAQLLGYLRASRIPDGLLINFGSQRLEIQKFRL